MSLKVRLLVGAAVPLAFAVPAAAQVQITTATTSPVATATANGGAAADVSISSAGSVTLTGQAGSTAVTINSNNTVTNAGTISTVNSDNSVGVRITPGITGGYSGGAISVNEDFTRTDTDNDTDLDGPLASGTGRTGLLVEPGGALNGSINLGTGASVAVEGNNSFGVSIQSVLNGNYRQQATFLDGAGATRTGATVNLTGANGVAVDLREDITGNVSIGGSTSATGEGSVGVRVLGDVAGEFRIDGGIVTTAFTTTQFDNFDDPALPNDTPIAGRFDADDLLAGGSAVQIRGDLSRGFLVNGNAVGGPDPTDDIKDVVQDFNPNRTAGTVTSVGSAPAIVIQSLDGAAGGELRLGLVRESVRDTQDDDDDNDLDEIIGVFDYDFGFINRGVITANGLNAGFAASALKFAGSADGAHQTIIDGGIFNGNAISASANDANANAVNLGPNTSTPQLVNSGIIQSGIATLTNHDAVTVRVDAGASLPSVTNNGSITANVRGLDGDAIAFQDLSGTVTTFRNNSRITATVSDINVEDSVTSGAGRAIALDLSHGTAAITLTQTDAADNTRIAGDILFGAGSDRFDLLSGEVVGDVDFGAGSDTLQINSARLFGDAIFRGAGANVSLVGSEMQGAITLGGASGALSFTGKSIYNGPITSSGGTVSMLVNDSTVNSNGAGTLNLSSMTLANNARFGFVVNNARAAGNIPIFNVTGVANIGANTVLTPIFEEFTDQPFTLRVLNASTLNLGGPLSSMLNAESPFLFDLDLVQPSANALDLVFRVKTEDELGLNTRQAGAYDAVLDLMGEQPTVAAAVSSLPNASDFQRGWSDLLPGNDAAVLKLLSANATAAFGATAHRLDLISEKPDAPGGAWVEEFGVFQESDATADSLAVSGGGFGVAAGIDLISTGSALIGGFAAIESVEVDEQDRTAALLNVAQTTVGGYGGWRAGNFAINAAGSYGFIDFTSERKVDFGGMADTVRAKWKGQSYNFGARATYNIPMGFLNVKPFVAADYIGFSEDGYSETAESFDELELIAEDGEASLATASYGLYLSGNFGSDDAFTFRPEFSAGYRNVLSWEAPSTSYRYAGSPTGPAFVLDAGQVDDGFVAGVGLNIESQFLNIKLAYDTGISDTSTTHFGSITLRMAFW